MQWQEQVQEMKVSWQGHEEKHVITEKLQNAWQPLDYKTDSKIILNAYIQKIWQFQIINSEIYCTTLHNYF